MLSILIPVYNYDVLPLVKELVQQCTTCGIKYEILCQDDASSSLTDKQAVEGFENCFFSSNSTNFGRAKNINVLAKKAKFEWLLLLDCDTFPTKTNFISNYLSEIEKKQAIIYGGLAYKSLKPQKEQLLRWTYGRKREALSLEKRNKNPKFSALTSNLFIQKEILIQNSFDETIKKYGYEDLYFFKLLSLKNFTITHIENPVFHLGLENSRTFLDKTKTALENLNHLAEVNKISAKESKVVAAYENVSRLKLASFFAYLFGRNQHRLERNLLSKNPSLFYFDLYKLGYYCWIRKAI